MTISTYVLKPIFRNITAMSFWVHAYNIMNFYNGNHSQNQAVSVFRIYLETLFIYTGIYLHLNLLLKL